MNPEKKICSRKRLCTDIECKECYEKIYDKNDKIRFCKAYLL